MLYKVNIEFNKEFLSVEKNQIKKLYKYKIKEYGFCLNRVLKIEKHGTK